MRRWANFGWLLTYQGLGAIAVAMLLGHQTDLSGILTVLGRHSVAGGAGLLLIKGSFTWLEQRREEVWVTESEGRLGVKPVASKKTEYVTPNTRLLRQGSHLWFFRADESIWTLEGLSNEDCDHIETLFCVQPALRIEPSERWGTTLGTALILGTLVSMSVVLKGVPLHGIVLTVALLPSLAYLRHHRGRRFVVGLDGVAVGHEFVPFAEMSSLSLHHQYVAVHRVGKSDKDRRVEVGDKIARAVYGHVRRILEPSPGADDESGAAVDAMELKRSTGESIEDWLDRVRGTIAGGDFRTPALPADAVQRVLRAPHTSNLVRAAIAAVLAPDDPEFVRGTIKQLASPEGKRLMHAALAGEHEFVRALQAQS